MKKIVQYWYHHDDIDIIETTPPKNKYDYDYTIRYKLRADNGCMLYNKKNNFTEKTVIIFPNQEEDWIEVTFQELKALQASNN